MSNPLDNIPPRVVPEGQIYCVVCGHLKYIHFSDWYYKGVDVCQACFTKLGMRRCILFCDKLLEK